MASINFILLNPHSAFRSTTAVNSINKMLCCPAFSDPALTDRARMMDTPPLYLYCTVVVVLVVLVSSSK